MGAAENVRCLVEFGTAGLSPYHRCLARGEDQFLRWDLDWFVANRDGLATALG